MYAVQLSSSQSITTSEGTYTGNGLTVVLSQNEYQTLNLSAYTKIVEPDLDILSLPIPTTAGTVIAGRFSYLGFSVMETSGTSSASFVLSDSTGTQSGGASSSVAIEYVSLAPSESAREFYVTENSPQTSAYPGLPVAGNLLISNITGTYSGVLRIGTR